MTNRLPPLNTLKTFEVAARHLSFTQASLELNVTPSAISHQIKLLEENLGIRLFRRENNRLLLTDAGSYLLPECSRTFAHLLDVTQKVRELGNGRPLSIALRPYFAQKWLMPRVSSFWQQHPEIELSLHHTIQFSPTSLDTYDIAIAWASGHFPGLESYLLVNGDLTPVCSPRTLTALGEPVTAASLAGQVLLDEETPDNWDRWLEMAGQPRLKPFKRVSIDDTNVRLHAAIDGQGFILTCLSLLDRELSEGTLVAPFHTALPHYSYYLLYRPDVLNNPQARIFIEWLKAQAA
ncbi:LysR substrate-binding domain-containing protein [Pseudomonas sp. NY15435]|uniref:LysR substrate-binding domain-containing protein n=1 Tax=Pseudomonas sp. NY15435 TaxID=3400358 RepID=UPI003A8C6A7D